MGFGSKYIMFIIVMVVARGLELRGIRIGDMQDVVFEKIGISSDGKRYLENHKNKGFFEKDGEWCVKEDDYSWVSAFVSNAYGHRVSWKTKEHLIELTFIFDEDKCLERIDYNCIDMR